MLSETQGLALAFSGESGGSSAEDWYQLSDISPLLDAKGELKEREEV